MEWVVQLFVLLLSIVLAGVKSLRYSPNALSDFELNRLVNSGNAHAIAEKERRHLIPTYKALKYIWQVILNVAIIVTLLEVANVVLGTFLSIFYIFISELIAARGWLNKMVHKWQTKLEPRIQKTIAKVAPYLKWLAPKHMSELGPGISSHQELRALIAADEHLLSPTDKTRLLGAFDFGKLTVGDIMVPRDTIATVEVKETVGPVLLDRLHKQGHRVYVAVKKDVDSVKGLLYMSDLSPLDPSIAKVADAIRPTVHYVPSHASAQDVLTASLLTGRQLFIVVDDAGKTKGLITLADTLAKLLGESLPKTAPIATTPTI